MTQLNGQSVASAYWWKNDAQSRGFNYDILPSELVGSLDVFKSPSADLDEGSIGGLVIVRTRKPLQFKKPFTAQASAEATYSDLPKKTDPQFSGLVNWVNEAKTFGVLVALSRQERTMRRDGLENFTDATKYNIVDQNGAVTPNALCLLGRRHADLPPGPRTHHGQHHPAAASDTAIRHIAELPQFRYEDG
ncbi:hypothetical protein [Massilia eburnea]|uniref:hypothetical protein n=1 Tax=Massilia eburnea TaxID=1776165 RepID=UPI003D6B6886